MNRILLDKLIHKPITGEWGEDFGEVNVIRTTNFTNNGELDLKNLVKRSISVSKVETKKLVKGDIIIEKSGGSPTQPVGRVVFFDQDGEYLCNNFTSILRPRTKLVFPKYLHYQLFAAHKFGVTESFQNKTTGIINLQLSRYISKWSIPLPPLETQKRIAQILDDAQALKQKIELLLKEYDTLAQSVFLDMFGDPVKNPKRWDIDILGNRIEKIQIGPFGSQLHQSDYVDEGIDLINPTNIKKDKIDYLNSVKILHEKYKSLPNYHLKIGDIIMARRGDLSKIGIVDKENKFCGTGSLFIRLGKEMDSTFIFWLLSHKSTIDKLYEKAQGITMANLNKKIIFNLPIIIPNIKFQNQFAEKITLIEQQKELAKQELKESEDLFNCLLQKAFKGELI